MKRLFYVAMIGLVLGLGIQHQAAAASAAEINVSVNEALKRFRADVDGGDVFLKKAEGVLVFPKVYKAKETILIDEEGAQLGPFNLMLKLKDSLPQIFKLK